MQLWFLQVVDMAMKIVSENIDRRIPQQVFLEGDGYDPDGNMVYDVGYCPNCKSCFEESDSEWECNYCPNCGQALIWWEEE